MVMSMLEGRKDGPADDEDAIVAPREREREEGGRTVKTNVGRKTELGVLRSQMLLYIGTGQ